MILVISDSHGDQSAIRKALDIAPPYRYVFHLGDGYNDLDGIVPEDKNVFKVKGNCDFVVAKDELFVEIKGKIIMACHGHRYGVKSSLNSIYFRAMEASVDLVMFGHSHKALLTVNNNITLLNPGSISQPRGRDNPSFGYIDENFEAKIITLYPQKP